MSQERPESKLDFSFSRRLPVITQAENAECGLACLAMIAGYHGYETDLTTLRRRYPISGHGMNLTHLIDIAGRMGFAARALRLEPAEREHLRTPCILHWAMNHFVVLERTRGSKVVIHDPSIGELEVGLEEFNRKFTGVALELTPTTDFQKRSEKHKPRLRDFWASIVGLKRSLGYIFLLSILLQLFMLLAPLYMQTVIDKAVFYNNRELLVVLAVGFGLLLIVRLGTSALRDLMVLTLSRTLGIQMAVNVFRHLIRLPMNYFSSRHMGDIVSRFGSLKNVRQLLSTTAVTAVVDGLMAFVTLAAMFLYSAKLAILVVAFVAIYVIFRIIFYRPFKVLNKEFLVAQAKNDTHFMESMRAAQTIKLLQKENGRQNQWENLLAETMNRGIKIGTWNILYKVTNGLIFGAENVVVIYFIALAVLDNVMSIGMLFAFMSYKMRFTSSVSSFIDSWIQLKMLDVHLERLSDIVHSEAERIDDHMVADFRVKNRAATQKSKGLGRIRGQIEVRNLSHRYGDNGPLVFDSLSFVVNAGESVAITGPSGCGKTTLLKCMAGLIIPSGGEILVDGENIQKMPHYRSNIGGLMQGDRLLSGSIMENIACFEPEIDFERVIRCAKVSCVHSEIRSMPMQYESLVGDMGSTLSSGQKQRILLARALYNAPRILFMDEATNKLDVSSEIKIMGKLSGLKMTRALVAHRPNTIQSADREIQIESRS